MKLILMHHLSNLEYTIYKLEKQLPRTEKRTNVINFLHDQKEALITMMLNSVIPE